MKPFLASLIAVLSLGLVTTIAHAAIPVYGYRVVHSYPHDPQAFTEGLFYRDGQLYEATGQVGESSIRRVDLATGKVLQQVELPPPEYGEGIIAWQDKLIELTWKSHHGYIYDLKSFQRLGRFDYPGEGWSLTRNATHLLMSDGTPDIRVLDPSTLAQVGTIHVTAEGKPVANLNELEWIKGQIWANVWMTNRIARIDPATGHVVGWVDLTGLQPPLQDKDDTIDDVLNGIAYDAKHDRIYVTGKRWPRLFEIKLTPPH